MLSELPPHVVLVTEPHPLVMCSLVVVPPQVSFCLVSSIIIFTHIFKTRYLDYFDKLKKEINIEKENIDKTSKENSYYKSTDADGCRYSKCIWYYYFSYSGKII